MNHEQHDQSDMARVLRKLQNTWRGLRTRWSADDGLPDGCDGSVDFGSSGYSADARPADARTALVPAETDDEVDPEIILLSEMLGVVAAGVLAMLVWLFVTSGLTLVPEPTEAPAMPPQTQERPEALIQDTPPSLAQVVDKLHTMTPAEVELPEHITAREKWLAYRLETEFGIKVEATKRTEPKPTIRRPVTLRDAMGDLEQIQENRDARLGVGKHKISKKTLREALEEHEVIPGCKRRIRKKKPALPINTIEPGIKINVTETP